MRMDIEMWMILGAIVVLVFVASFFKQNPGSEDPDYDRRLTTDVGVDSSEYDGGSWGSDSGSDSGDSSDSSDHD